MLTTEQLNNWFTYHAPTEETAPKYAAIRDAEFDAHMALAAMKLREGVTDSPLSTDDCVVVNTLTRRLAEYIDANAPDSADKSAAIRCVRLARNAANEFIMANVNGVPVYMDLMQEATRQLVMARWQANSAIACGGK